MRPQLKEKVPALPQPNRHHTVNRGGLPERSPKPCLNKTLRRVIGPRNNRESSLIRRFTVKVCRFNVRENCKRSFLIRRADVDVLVRTRRITEAAPTTSSLRR
jgi:hypothetical protein